MSNQFVQDLISALPVSKKDDLEGRIDRCELNIKHIYNLERKKKPFTIDMDELNCEFLKEDDIFNFLKSELQSWNQKIEECQLGNVDRIEFRNKMYQELGDHLVQVNKTQNTLIQRKYLEDIKFWYNMQLQILKKGQTCSEPTSFQSSMVLRKNQNQNPNINISIDEQFQHRSKYSDIEPAEDRVKDFGRKYPMQPFTQESFINPTTRPSTVQGNKTSSQWFTNSLLQNRKEAGQFLDRPDSQFSNYRFIKSSQSDIRSLNRNLISSESQKRPDTQMTQKSNQNNPWNYNNSMNFQSFKPFGSPDRMNESTLSNKKMAPSMVPDAKNYGDDRMTQLAYEMDDENEFRKYEEIRGTFNSYAPNFSESELRLEQNWLQARNKELAKKREDEEMVQYIDEWATNKGQYEEEIAKKQQYYLHGSRFHDLDIQNSKEKQSKEVEQKDFEIKQLDEEEEEEEELYLQYLKLKNASKAEKQIRQQVIDNQNKQDHIDSFQEIKEERFNIKKQQQQYMQQQTLKQDTMDNTKLKSSQDNSFTSGSNQNIQSLQQQQNLQAEDIVQESPSKQQPREIIFRDFKQNNFVSAEPLTKKADLQMTNHNNPPILPVNRAMEERKKLHTSQGFRRNNHSNIEDLEREMKKDKIAKIRRMRGHIIGQKQEKVIDAEEVEIQRRKDLSISAYMSKPNQLYTRPATQQNSRKNHNQSTSNMISRQGTMMQQYSSNNLNLAQEGIQMQNSIQSAHIKRQKSCLTGNFRPFSSILQGAQNKDRLKKDEMKDVKRIKNAFNKSGIRCNAQTLSLALITPEFVPQEKLAKLPQQGMMLFQNKFAQTKKGKKGKKKKK